MKKLPDYGKISFDEFEGMKFEDIVPEACAGALDLLKKFLVYPSKQRIPAQQVGKTRRDVCVLMSLLSLIDRHYYISISTRRHCHVITLIYPFPRDGRIVMSTSSI